MQGAGSLEDAILEAEAMVATCKHSVSPDDSPESRPTVYILEGCDCPDQGGTHWRYHVHAFTPDQYQGWHALHEATVIRQYPT